MYIRDIWLLFKKNKSSFAIFLLLAQYTGDIYIVVTIK